MTGKDETTKENKKTEKSSNVWVNVFLLMGCIGVFAIFIWLLSTHLGSPNSENEIAVFSYTKSDLGTLGDLLGGVLNPILSFITICLLIWSIQIQIDELRETRKEMERSSNALEQTNDMHAQNLKSQERNILIPITTPALEDLMKQIYTSYKEDFTIIMQSTQNSSIRNKKTTIPSCRVFAVQLNSGDSVKSITDRYGEKGSEVTNLFNDRIVEIKYLLDEAFRIFSALVRIEADEFLYLDHFIQARFICHRLSDIARKLDLKDQITILEKQSKQYADLYNPGTIGKPAPLRFDKPFQY